LVDILLSLLLLLSLPLLLYVLLVVIPQGSAFVFAAAFALAVTQHPSRRTPALLSKAFEQPRIWLPLFLPQSKSLPPGHQNVVKPQTHPNPRQTRIFAWRIS
jgi:hypothetical protein